MLRGCQRKIYYVRNAESRIFEEAYFVLKKRVSSEYEPGTRYVSDREMAEEAERLVRELCPERRESPPRALRIGGRVGAFALGAVSSSALIGTVALLLVFL